MPPRPHLLARSRTASLADRALRALWRSGLDAPPRLEPDFLWAAATRQGSDSGERPGRSATEVAEFRLRLDRLCQALRDEARLNALGTVMAYGQLTHAIRVRHALGRLWQTCPDLARAAIAPPIIVVGQMRSGTTRVHRLLASDPGHCGTPLYRALDPVPRRPDLRLQRAALCLAVARTINPWMDAIHPFGARRDDEELAWLSHALVPVAVEAQYAIPSYVGWSEAHDVAPAYREFARTLRTDAALHGTAHLPRVLKCPQFAEDLPTLLQVFPDARVVVVRRAEADVLESTLSLVASQMAFQSDAVELADVRREWQRKIALRDRRIAKGLDAFAGPVAQVDYRALDADWHGAIAGIYRQLGLELSPAALAAMHRLQSEAAQSPHRTHRQIMQQMARG